MRIRDLFSIKNMSSSKKREMRNYVTLLGGMYLLYMVYITLKGYNEIPQNRRVLIIVCMLLFVVVGIYLVIISILRLTSGFREARKERKEEERKAREAEEAERRAAAAEGRVARGSLSDRATFYINSADDTDEE